MANVKLSQIASGGSAVLSTDVFVVVRNGNTDVLASLSTISGPITAQTQRPVNTQTGTTYALVIGDQNKMVTLNNAAPITLTIPANASVAFPVGTEIDLLQLGAGQVTVAITTDTLNSFGGLTKIAGQYGAATLKKISSTSWVLIGNLG